jgi:hypothetical protein
VRTWLAVALAACLLPAWAQGAPPAKKAARPATAKPVKAHRRATPEQIRRFKEIEKKKHTTR